MNIDEVATRLANTNDPKYNYLKTIEELAELNEILIKSVTKNATNRPPLEKIIEESAHVIFRINILSKMLGIEEQVQEEIEVKAEYLNNFYEKEKFIGTL